MIGRREHSRKSWASRLAELFESAVQSAGREALVVAHKNADMDAVASALGLVELLQVYGVKARPLFPEGISRQARSILSGLGVPLEQAGPVSGQVEPVTVFVVDTANPTQLGEAAGVLGKARLIVVIDHHASGQLRHKAAYDLTVPEAGSTSEIVAFIASVLRVPLSTDTANLLLAGILADSRWLRISGPFQAEAISYLLDRGASISLLHSLLREGQERDTSERIAILKAMSRLRYHRVCRDVLIGITHVGNFEATVARLLVDIGADVAVVAKDTREGVRVSIRTSRRAEQSGITALEVARFIAERFRGEGGGHKNAAGVEARRHDLTAELLVEQLSRSLPGRLGRLCTRARMVEDERGEDG